MKEDAWISQAEAARIRKVSRQAISKLIAAGRLGTTVFGGRTFVSRDDVRKFERRPPGRKKS
jgi:excisionase family DNA binding protein